MLRPLVSSVPSMTSYSGVGHNLDEFKDIGSWEECGTYLVYVKKEKTKLVAILISAHICNIASGCKFWSWIGSGNHNCYTKDSNEGLQASNGVVSGERGCVGVNTDK